MQVTLEDRPKGAGGIARPFSPQVHAQMEAAQESGFHIPGMQFLVVVAQGVDAPGDFRGAYFAQLLPVSVHSPDALLSALHRFAVAAAGHAAVAGVVPKFAYEFIHIITLFRICLHEISCKRNHT